MNYKYIDTHAHLNLNAFNDDWEEVAVKCDEEDVTVINIGTKLSTSKKAVEIAESFGDGVYAIIGLHPVHTSSSYHDEKELGGDMSGFTSRGETFDKEFYRELAKSKKVVGIGETGLDYYRLEEDTRAVQEKAFIEQIELANELNLPLMIHARASQGNQASNKTKNCSTLSVEQKSSKSGFELGVGDVYEDVYDDVYEILKKYAKVRGNIHFYAGTWEQAKKFFDIGFTISFTGVITFPPAHSARAGAKDYEEVVRNAPLDMIHAETDCPYVAPVPHRGKRCEPWMVQQVYQKIAEIKEEDEEKVRFQLLENAKKLYDI